jgi:hypothetical protein
MIDYIIIKMKKGGAGIGPDYSLTIHGNGKVIYDGVENVKIKGMVESSISNDKFISLLSKFKESGFFNLSNNYIGDLIGRPYTVLSISIPKDDGDIVTKSIKYHHDDNNIPKEVKILEDKIDEIVGSNRWTGDISDYKEFKLNQEFEPIVKPTDNIRQKIVSKPSKKKPVKLIATIIIIIITIFVSILLYIEYSGVFSPSIQNEGTNNAQATEKTFPEILILDTASYVDQETGNYTSEVIFSKGENISIYLKYTNISTINNETCDIHFELIIEHNNTQYHKPPGINRTYLGKYIQIWWFVTSDSWPSGVYNVTVNLTDNFNNSTISKSMVFTLF